jgi:outer membrane translocation and assembly module TamA
MRYQNDATLLVETEWAYNLYRRWWLSAFSGTGKAFTDFDDFGSQQWVYNIGTGLRYNLARRLGVDMGADFAWGNGKDFAFYIVFGTSW